MPPTRLRHIALDSAERAQVRLALLARIDVLIPQVAEQKCLDHMEEIAAQAQQTIDAYSAMWDEVISREFALENASRHEGRLQRAMQTWRALHPKADKSTSPDSTEL